MSRVSDEQLTELCDSRKWGGTMRDLSWDLRDSRIEAAALRERVGELERAIALDPRFGYEPDYDGRIHGWYCRSNACAQPWGQPHLDACTISAAPARGKEQREGAEVKKREKGKRSAWLVLDPNGWAAKVYVHQSLAVQHARDANYKRPPDSNAFTVARCDYSYPGDVR